MFTAFIEKFVAIKHKHTANDEHRRHGIYTTEIFVDEIAQFEPHDNCGKYAHDEFQIERPDSPPPRGVFPCFNGRVEEATPIEAYDAQDCAKLNDNGEGFNKRRALHVEEPLRDNHVAC